MMRRRVLVGSASGLVLLLAGQWASGQQEPPQPFASDGGRVEIVPPRPIDENTDSLNARVAADTVDGLVVAVTIDGTTITLDSAMPARIPRGSKVDTRDTAGDVVRATAFVGTQSVATTIVSDNVINASEGDGLIRTERRQIVIAFAADRAIETIEVEAAATGARATLDVRSAYSAFCNADPASRWCPQRR